MPMSFGLLRVCRVLSWCQNPKDPMKELCTTVKGKLWKRVWLLAWFVSVAVIVVGSGVGLAY